MARSKLMMMALSAAMVMAGAVYDNALKFLGSNPTILYLAGQFKMATGDTNTGLDLIGRAASARHVQPAASPAKTAQPAPSNICTKRTSSLEASAPILKAVTRATGKVETVRDMNIDAQVGLAGFSPDRFRAQLGRVGEFAFQRAILEEMKRHKEAFAKLNRIDVPNYVVVMQAMPHLRVDVTEMQPLTP